MNQVARALQFFRPDFHRLIVVAFLLLSSVAASVLKPWPLALLIDSALGSKPLPVWMRSIVDPSHQGLLVGLLGLSVLLLHLAAGGLAAAQNHVAIQVALSGLRRVRDEVFTALQRLSLRHLHGARSGELVHRAAWDAYSFQTLFQQGLVGTTTAALSLLFMMGILWRINKVLALVALMLVPLLLLVVKFFGQRLADRASAAQQADSLVTSFVQQSIAALPLVQSHTREAHESSAFGARTAGAMEKRLVQHGWELAYWLAIAIVFAFGTAAIVWIGSRQVLAGQMSVGELVVVLAYLTQLYEPVQQLARAGATVSEGIAGVARVFEILDTPDEVKESPKARPVIRADAAGTEPTSTGAVVRVTGAIEFENVSFRYQRDRAVLEDISFRLQPGESLAIVGPRGVGKTTLLHLVPRFFDPTSGTVRLEGVDVRELRLKELRAQMALVLQEPILLPSSIADNIAFGRPGARRSEIEAAARAAHADEFIRKLPNGYMTITGEGGTRLSLGERQRLSLARAFLRDAPILLLDEPAASLDPDSEAMVAASLAELMKGRTTLMVAHRLTTVDQVDQVLVLEEGRLVEQGAPAKLRGSGGYLSRVAQGLLTID